MRYVEYMMGNTELWHKLQELNKEDLVTEELSVGLFIVKCDSEQSVWHVAVGRGDTELLE